MMGLSFVDLEYREVGFGYMIAVPFIYSIIVYTMMGAVGEGAQITSEEDVISFKISNINTRYVIAAGVMNAAALIVSALIFFESLGAGIGALGLYLLGMVYFKETLGDMKMREGN